MNTEFWSRPKIYQQISLGQDSCMSSQCHRYLSRSGVHPVDMKEGFNYVKLTIGFFLSVPAVLLIWSVLNFSPCMLLNFPIGMHSFWKHAGFPHYGNGWLIIFLQGHEGNNSQIIINTNVRIFPYLNTRININELFSDLIEFTTLNLNQRLCLINFTHNHHHHYAGLIILPSAPSAAILGLYRGMYVNGWHAMLVISIFPTINFITYWIEIVEGENMVNSVLFYSRNELFIV